MPAHINTNMNHNASQPKHQVRVALEFLNEKAENLQMPETSNIIKKAIEAATLEMTNNTSRK